MQGQPEQTANAGAAARWTVADAIDFECLLDAAERTTGSVCPPGAAYDTDRQLFAEHIAPRLGARSGERREVFHAWVDAMRQRATAPLPGAAYDAGLQAAHVIAAALGLLCGIGLTGSLLSHSTTEPINALMFLGATVGLQLAFFLLAATVWLLRGAGWRFGPIGQAWLLVVAAAGRLLKRLPGERRDALRAALATLQRRSAAHAALLQCQLLGVTQGFAIAFNLGVLGAMLLVYLPFVELRFGWQSTYSISAAAVHEAVLLIAAPWHWIGADLAPSAPQVLASQYARGQGAQTLPADAAHAWWPFLLCAVAVYGLLLRGAVALLAALSLRRGLARLAFTQPAANALWRRLHGPLLRAEGGDARLPAGSAPPSTLAAMPTAALLVLADELALDAARATAWAERQLGWRFASCVAAGADDDRLPGALADALRRAPDGVLVLLPAALDPIVAVAGFLRRLVRPGTELLLLIGQAEGGDFAATAAPERLAIWRRFVAIQQLPASVE